jgi:ADP-dependent NAD(P)H-hydrate dehydratase
MVFPNNKIRVWLVSRPTHHTVQSLIRAPGLSRLPSTPKHTEAHRNTPLPESRRFRFRQLGGQNLGDMLDQKLPNLQSRSKESHKGSFGHALMIGGARGMGGAIAIAGMACLRSGAGLVTLAVPSTSLDLVASFHPCYMTVPLDCDDSGRLLRSSLQQLVSPLEKATCVAIGPGLGRSADSDAVVETIFKTLNKNVIFDADALNAISDSEPWLRLRADRSSLAHGSTGSEVTNRILTPHPGEWQRLSGVLAQDREGQKSIADEIAGHTKSVILLKGHRTYITDGSRSFENETGNATIFECLRVLIGVSLLPRIRSYESLWSQHWFGRFRNPHRFQSCTTFH